MTAPMDKQQLQLFLVMVNYMGTFIPNLSHHTEPLKAMLKKDNIFHWEEQQTWSFQKIKALIAKANEIPLRYYDRTKPVKVQARFISQRLRSMPHTGVQGRGPTDCLCQQEFDRCGDKICQHRDRTSRHCLCLPEVQHVSTQKKLHRRE